MSCLDIPAYQFELTDEYRLLRKIEGVEQEQRKRSFYAALGASHVRSPLQFLPEELHQHILEYVLERPLKESSKSVKFSSKQ